ncbi:MAG: GtrA family protein [Bacteroidales bacterium]|jgi:putative flippase GtrA|nr:GtrA family protein [Bacteroidales bacterium]
MERQHHALAQFLIVIIDWFHTPFKRYIPTETFRYATTGGGNLVLDTILYFFTYNFIIAKEIIDFGFIAISPHIAALLIVFPITFTTGFLMAKYINFNTSVIKGRIQLFRYMVVVAGSLLINYAFLKFFVEYLNIWPTISKMITAVFAVTYSYTMQRFYTFKTNKKPLIK